MGQNKNSDKPRAGADLGSKFKGANFCNIW